MITGLSLIVFAITLTVTKSKLFGTKREFVEKRYQAAKVGDQKPGYLHWWWHAMWTCPMCLGFWISIIVCAFYPTEFGYVGTCLIIYGLNWLWHCLEDVLFQIGQALSNLIKNF